MRIRKTVAKLLSASAIVCPVSSAWAQSHSSINVSSTEVCLLNQSPWDACPNPELFFRNCNKVKFQDLESVLLPNSKEEKKDVAGLVIFEKNKGCLGRKGLEKQERKNKPLQVCKSECEEKKRTIKGKNSNETKKMKKEEEEGVRVAEEEKEKEEEEEGVMEVWKKNKKEKEGVVELCKKNDGRKWFCKRPAQPSHKFCEYHALQSRFYYTGSTIDKPKKKKQKQEKEKEKKDAAASSLYYYYDGFGPWRGKIRGDTKSVDDDKEDDDHVQKEEVLMEGCDLTMAGGNSHEEDDNKEIVSSSKGNGEKKVGKKRGRKPVKCRSLKSLF